MKILIVEDDFPSRKFMGLLLKKYGEVEFAVNGTEAVEKFRNALMDKKPFDIIFLDIMLPNMDGHGVLNSVKSLEEENDIFGFDGVKIVMTSALDDNVNIKSAFREQCDAYLTKPINSDKIKNVMESLF